MATLVDFRARPGSGRRGWVCQRDEGRGAVGDSALWTEVKTRAGIVAAGFGVKTLSVPIVAAFHALVRYFHFVHAIRPNS
jgi:hypothetical protein